jgi:hypothetical protein
MLQGNENLSQPNRSQPYYFRMLYYFLSMDVNYHDAYDHILSYYENKLGITPDEEENAPLVQVMDEIEARLFKKRKGQFDMAYYSSLTTHALNDAAFIVAESE